MAKILFLFLSFLTALPLSAQVQVRIDSLIRVHPLMSYASMGIHVVDLTTDSVLYTREASKIHRPASTTKTFTAATALKDLGVDYRICTSVYTTGEVKKHHHKHVLKGDVFIKGNFDPAFSQQDLQQMLSALKALGIDAIHGKVYTDLSMKSRTLSGMGWCWDDTGDDSPLLSPLIVDKDTTFLSRFITGLEEAGIGFKGETGDSIVPAGATLLVQKSRTLGEILPHCLKTSDNRYAEAILYQLGTLNTKDYDTADDCLSFVNALVNSFGYPREEWRLVDGSGLSDYNCMSAEIEVALMKYIYKESGFYETFRQALPIAGVDGTLKSRTKGTPAEGRVYAKTGSLTGTNALTGYIYPANGHVLAFSMLNDGVPAGEAKRMRDLQDQILSVLASL